MLLKMLDWIFLAIFLVELLFFAKWKLHEGRIFFWMGWLEIRREDLLTLHIIGAVSVILGVLIYHDNPGNAFNFITGSIGGLIWLATAVYMYYEGHRVQREFRKVIAGRRVRP